MRVERNSVDLSCLLCRLLLPQCYLCLRFSFLLLGVVYLFSRSLPLPAASVHWILCSHYSSSSKMSQVKAVRRGPLLLKESKKSGNSAIEGQLAVCLGGGGGVQCHPLTDHIF